MSRWTASICRKSGNVRRAEVAVSVDGSAASAFGVMSQGELHSLAVSVFLPQRRLPREPVSLHGHRRPGAEHGSCQGRRPRPSARRAATDRQVIVFTHDERLPEAARRLGLDATVFEVTRRPESVVEVRVALDPVERYIDDARALVRSEDVPTQVVERVVPGFCRHALEAACMQAIRRRRLAAGSSHADVEDALRRCTTLDDLLGARAVRRRDQGKPGAHQHQQPIRRTSRRRSEAREQGGARSRLGRPSGSRNATLRVLARKLAELT